MDTDNKEILEAEDQSIPEEKLEPPKSNTLKVGKRTAFVYTGAAILIVVVGLRTLLQMADEGFGMVEYITVGALMIEFSVLLLYAFTIYSVSKDDAKKEGFSVESTDMPVVALQLQALSESVNQEIKQMRVENERIHSVYATEYPALSQGLANLTSEFQTALNQIQTQQMNSIEQSKSLVEAIANANQARQEPTSDDNSPLSKELMNHLEKNEALMQQNITHISSLTNGIKEVIEEQVTLRIRQEIQHILSAPIVKGK